MWGLDPAWKSAPSVGWGPDPHHDLPNSVHVGPAVLAENGQAVQVAGHEVKFDADRNLWYADVDLGGSKIKDGYFPFVRFALCRYQPDSMPGLEMSGVVVADFVQLAPDRSAAIYKLSRPSNHKRATARSFRVVVRGHSYDPSGQHPVAVVTVEVEKRRTGVPAGDFGWESTGTTFTLHHTKPQGVDQWSGTVSVPIGGGSYRLVIRENELYSLDRGRTHPSRVVYLDTFEV
jgi:hypothetical protein